MRSSLLLSGGRDGSCGCWGEGAARGSDQRLCVDADDVWGERAIPIAHGWNLVPGDTDYDALGNFGFKLEPDGQQVKANYVERVNTLDGGGFLTKRWVFNFRKGFLRGRIPSRERFGPCEELVLGGYYFGECAKPTQVVTAIAPLMLVVEFMP